MSGSTAQPATDRELTVLRFALVGVPMISLLYGVGRYAYGLFLPAFQQEFGLSLSLAGLVAGTATAIYTALAIFFSVAANAFRPTCLIVSAGGITAAGILMVAAAHNRPLFVCGIVLASFGAGIAPPGYLQVIGRQLRREAQNNAIAILNAGGAPGLALAAITALMFSGEWRITWIILCALCVIVTIANLVVISEERGTATTHIPEASGKLMLRLMRPGAMRVVVFSLMYGVMLSSYYTFSVSLVVEMMQREDVRYVFWALVGISGLPAMLTAAYVERFGTHVVISLSFLALGLSSWILQVDSVYLIVVSALLFGVFSIVPNSACLIMSHDIYGHDRPALGWGVVFAAMSVGMTLAPIVAGMIADAFTLKAMFQVLAVFSMASAAGVFVLSRTRQP